jgi:transcriptional regulator with XRE-family HTH domain
MVNYVYLALRLKEARKRARLSAQEAGGIVERSDKTIYAWENGQAEPSAEQLVALCHAYGVDISYFYPPDVASDDKLTVDERLIVEQYRNLGDDAKATLRGILDVLGGK